MSDSELIPQQMQTSALVQAGRAANQAAAAHVFADYLRRKSDNTLLTQRHALSAFADFLGDVGAGEFSAETLQTQPSAWEGMTWGLVEAFVLWQLQIGYAVSTVNNRLSSVKAYAGLAMKAGIIATDEYLLIKSVSGYGGAEAKRIDARRDTTRLGHKKDKHIMLSTEQAQRLKRGQPDLPQGIRDRLLMCLLLDHGLRCGEVALLNVGNVDAARGELTFFRPKVNKVQIHNLTDETLNAFNTYNPFLVNHTPDDYLLRGSLKGGKLSKTRMSERAITKRVNVLGEMIGVFGLSAHDCRHYWATDAARNGTDPFALQEAGGWSSLTMPRRYVDNAAIANQGVKLT